MFLRFLMAMVLCLTLNTALFAGDDPGINVNSLKKLAKDKDKAVAYTATAELATYYRREGDLQKAEKLLSEFSSPSGFDRLSAKIAIPYLRCLLENAHIKAIKKDLPGSLQLLNWAERRPRDYERAFSCLKYAEILLDLNESERAQAYLKNVNTILRKHISDTAASGGAIGQGSKALDTQEAWRTLRDRADYLALEIEEAQLNKKFGATYASYVKLRRLQKIVKRSKSPRYFNEAIRLCDDIAETDPQSQFAAAAGYLKGQLLLNNLAENPKKAVKQAKDHLEKFIKTNPEGLYRGEAMMLLGKISLEKEWDAKDAEKYYSQALDWFKQAREKRNALSLYAPMSNDLQAQTKATQELSTLNQWSRTVYHDEDPLKLYNTASSPPWYANENELELVYMTGFFAFMRKDFQKAKSIWEQVPKLSSNIRNMAEFLPNIYTRLMYAVKNKHFYIDDGESSGIEKNLFLMFQYAQFLLWRERYIEAEKLFEQVYNKTKNAEGKAAALSGIAYCRAINLKTWDKRETVEKYYLAVINNKKLHGKPIVAYALYKYIDYLYNFPNSRDTFYQYIRKFKKTYKKTRHYRMVLARETNAYSLDGEFNKAWATAQIIKNELNDEDLYKGVVWGINAMKENYDKAKPKSK